MTQRQQSELEKAIERACQNYIVVVAQGRFRDSNQQFFLTTSASSARHHVVRLVAGNKLACDCEGAQHGHICQHRASVYMHLQVQADRRSRQAEEVEAALEAEKVIREASVMSGESRILH